ncbi:PAS domain S-box protein [Polaromonas sp. OV174]|uniref:PAS domain S-box protein n=1 Tax=Polaromonas sp. OV174 TaxID=1855300 RepID=UPI00210112C6|nr:PAS domain S-box protein [Polaromonas sp. OV174]
MGLRSRLVLLVLLALLPVFGLLAYSAAQSRQAALQMAQSSLQSQVLLVAAHQQRLVEKTYELLNGIASAPHIKRLAPALCTQHLKNLHAEHPEFTNLGVARLDGRLVCDAREMPKNTQIRDRAYFQQVVDGQPFAVGLYAIGRHSGQPGLGFAVPVHNAAGQLVGVAFGTLGLPGVTAPLLASLPTLPGADLALLDARGTVLATFPEQSDWPGKPHPDTAVQQAVQVQQPGLRHAQDAAADQRIFAFAPIPVGARKGLFVALSVPHEVLAAHSREVLAVELLALLGVMLFGVACTWWMGNRMIVGPARAILKEAHQVAQGDLGARVKSAYLRQGELGAIGRSFNRMAESLQARRDELDAALQHADKERILLDLMLNSMSEGVIATDTEGRFLLFNAAARKLLSTPDPGASLEEWQGCHQLLQLDAETLYSCSERPLRQAISGVSVDNLELLFRRPGIEDRVLRVSARPLSDATGRLLGGLLVFNDITEHKVAEGIAQAQEQVLTLIAGGAALPQSLEAIVRLIEKSSPDSLCSILLVDGQQLRHGAAPSLPERFTQAIDGLPIVDGAGACGTAAFRKESVLVEDCGHDPLMRDYRDLLLAHGLRACWSSPVLSIDGEVLATFATYRPRPGAPQAGDLALLATATRLAGIALERARAETAVVSSEARFRELADNIKDVFYNVDARSGRVLYISPGYEKVWGRSCESLYANPGSHVKAVLTEDRPLLKQAAERKFAGEMANAEYRILASDGQLRWIRDHSYPVFNSVGELERVVGTARDITDSKLAELALVSTHRALQMLSRSSLVINRMDEEAELLAEICRVAVDVGDYRMAWVGYAQDDEAKSILPMAHVGDSGGYLATISLNWRYDHAAGQGPAGLAIRSGAPAQCADIGLAGNIYWHQEALQRGFRSVICLPLRNGQRNFGVLCMYAGEVQPFAADETKLLQELADNLAFGIVSLRTRRERLRSQEAARQAAVQLREQASLLDRTQDAIMVRNLDGSLRYWNQGAERLYGWRADEVLGKTMAALMYRDPDALGGLMQQALAQGGDWSCELEQLARDGSAVEVEMRCTVLRDPLGQLDGVLCINTDIGERKRAREEILRLNASLEERVHKRTAQLEFANKQLEAFSYSVSHDLRSPLSAIDGFSGLLEQTLSKMDGGPLIGRGQHYLERIRAGVVQMDGLIEAMLSLAQVSRSKLRWEPVDLSALAQALLSRYQEREPGRLTRLQVQAGVLAQGDSRLLNQVLDNLLSNAWKFSAYQACTEISWGCETGSAGEAVYFVRDKGAGFDMAHAEKLFGVFQRLHAGAEFSGTGIGLATVQRIIERHGGRIWGESVLGQGATFYFTLGTRRL